MDCPYCKVGAYSDYCKCNKQEQENDPICPHTYRCTKLLIWKELPAMRDCTLRQNSGNVQFERHGYLYVQQGSEIIKVVNPFDYVPDDVELKKINGNYKVTKENKK